MPASTEDLRVEHAGPAGIFPGSPNGRALALKGPSQVPLTAVVLALLSPFLALRNGIVQKILFAAVILDIPLQFETTFFHRPADADLGAFRGLIISMTTLALAGLYAGWFIEALADKNAKRRPALHINLPLTLFVIFAALSVLVATDVTLSLFELFLFVELYLVYFYVANKVRTRPDVLFVVTLLLIGAVVESFAIIVLRFTNMGTTVVGPAHIYMDSDPGTGWMRVGGTMGPNVAGAYLSVLLAFAVSVLFTNVGHARKWLAVSVLALGQIAIILTFSRGGWIAFVVAVGILCGVAWKHRGRSLKVPIAVATIVLLCLPFSDAISNRVFGDDKGAAESRIPLMNLALRIIADNPLLGVGSNNFSVVMNRYLTGDFRSPKAFLFVVHNKYLLIWAETGILGLSAFLAFLLAALRTGWRCWKVRDPLLSPLALGLVAGIAGNMVHMGVDHFRSPAAQELLWFAAALVVAMYRIANAPALDSYSSMT